MDRRRAVSYFGAVIRSFLAVLAVITLMVVSLTASAYAMRVDNGPYHPVQMQSVTAPLQDETCPFQPCGGMADSFCAFSCAGLASAVNPDRPDCLCAYGSSEFFVAQAPQRAGRGPELAERPPRPSQF